MAPLLFVINWWVKISHSHRSLFAGFQMSDWWAVRWAVRDDWKSITIDSGEQSVMMISMMSMLALSATVLDTGWHWFIVAISQNKRQCNEASISLMMLWQVLYCCVTDCAVPPVLTIIKLWITITIEHITKQCHSWMICKKNHLFFFLADMAN